MNDQIPASVMHQRDVAGDFNSSAGEIIELASRTLTQAEGGADRAKQLADLFSSPHLLFAEFRVQPDGQPADALAVVDEPAVDERKERNRARAVEIF